MSLINGLGWVQIPGLIPGISLVKRFRFLLKFELRRKIWRLKALIIELLSF